MIFRKCRNLSYLVVLLIIAAIFDLAFYIYMSTSYSEDVDSYLDKKNTEFAIYTKHFIDMQNQLSEVIFHETVNKPEILKLYSRAMTGDLDEQNEVRKELWDKLSDTYQYLKSINIKQLHFHTPDNRSFLRFHRPLKYGDDLTDFRYSVKMTNEKKMEHIGFEEGRIFNGFRHVFPLFYQGRHIGSVEASFSVWAVSEMLKQINVHTSYFIEKKDVVSDKVFKEEQSNYRLSPLSDNFVVENKFIEDSVLSSDLIKSVDSMIANEYQDELEEMEDFSVYYLSDTNSVIVSFYAVQNVKGNKVGYYVTYNYDEVVMHYYSRYQLVLQIGLYSIPFIIILVGLYLNNIRRIKNKNKQLEESDVALREYNDKLQKQAEELEEQSLDLITLNATKDKFFSIIAHDLKSPFSGFVGITKMLVEEKAENFTEEERQEIYANLNDSADSLFKLLDNLLQWSRLQRGHMQYYPQPTFVRMLVEANINIQKVVADSKDIELINNVPEDMQVYIDNSMINTVFRNFISNALKFTPRGGKIEIFSAEDRNGCHTIAVKDSGIGMPDDMKSKLFRLDAKISRPGTEGESSTGLGLILCGDLVQKNNGEIWVDSEEGKGTVFYFTMPKYSGQQ